jgi:hypothetical protein
MSTNYRKGFLIYMKKILKLTGCMECPHCYAAPEGWCCKVLESKRMLCIITHEHREGKFLDGCHLESEDI